MKFKRQITLRNGLLLSFIFFNIYIVNAQDPYQDVNLPVETRVNDLISRMTLPEKLSQLGNQSPAI